MACDDHACFKCEHQHQVHVMVSEEEWTVIKEIFKVDAEISVKEVKLNLLPHSLHWNGFTPVCTMPWRIRRWPVVNSI